MKLITAETMIYTTLKRIRAHSPCESSWRKLLTALGKTRADDEPLAYADILRHLNLDDALWCLRCEPQHDSLWRHMACDFSDMMRHLMTDPRSHAAIDTARRFADGYATVKELGAARADARPDARADAWSVAWSAARAAAWAAAGDAAGDAARTVAWAAARSANKAIFLHRVNGDTPIYAWGSGVRINWKEQP